MGDSIQQGIYFRPGETAPPAYRLLLLNLAAGTAAADAARAIASIWSMLEVLREGRLRELEGQPEVHARSTKEQYADLSILLAYGRRFFDMDVHDPALTQHERPAYLVYLDTRSPFPSIGWASNPMPGEADIALQFTAGSLAAVNSAAVEVWKAIQDDHLPLDPVGSYDGFARPDRRGWLEFHDGVTNMDSALRAAALEAAEPHWMAGGTYMAFLRICVDLTAWRAMGRTRQEIAVGRDKLTGAALETVREVDGELVPVPRTFDMDDPESVAEWRDPSQRADRHLENSHIHRTNQSRGSPGAPGSFRIFRQGYEFLHAISADGPHLGLNFVSFQRDLRVFQHVMNAPGWLGDSTFGGDGPQELLMLEAGGFYAAPRRGNPFPGAWLFQQPTA